MDVKKKREANDGGVAADLRALGLEEGVHSVVRRRRAVAPHGVLLAVAGQVRPVRVAAGGVHPTDRPARNARGGHDTRGGRRARSLLRGLASSTSCALSICSP
jgi:hypothetical protein